MRSSHGEPLSSLSSPSDVASFHQSRTSDRRYNQFHFRILAPSKRKSTAYTGPTCGLRTLSSAEQGSQTLIRRPIEPGIRRPIETGLWCFQGQTLLLQLHRELRELQRMIMHSPSGCQEQAKSATDCSVQTSPVAMVQTREAPRTRGRCCEQSDGQDRISCPQGLHRSSGRA